MHRALKYVLEIRIVTLEQSCVVETGVALDTHCFWLYIPFHFHNALTFNSKILPFHKVELSSVIQLLAAWRLVSPAQS